MMNIQDFHFGKCIVGITMSFKEMHQQSCKKEFLIKNLNGYPHSFVLFNFCTSKTQYSAPNISNVKLLQQCYT